MNEDFKQVIKRYLDERAKNDELFARVYAKENKSLDECCKFIMTKAREVCKAADASSNAVAVNDEVVYGWAVHYYDEDEVKVDVAVEASVAMGERSKKAKKAAKKATEKAVKAVDSAEKAADSAEKTTDSAVDSVEKVAEKGEKTVDSAEKVAENGEKTLENGEKVTDSSVKSAENGEKVTESVGKTLENGGKVVESVGKAAVKTVKRSKKKGKEIDEKDSPFIQLSLFD